MANKLHTKGKIKGTNVVGKIIGKGYVERNGKIEEKHILQIDTSKITLQEVAPFLGEIAVDIDKITKAQ